MYDLSRVIAAGLVGQVDYHESLGSTSDRAMALAAAGDGGLPLLVLAERQTAGRGRGINRWFTAEGAITFSIVLAAPPERLPQERWPQVALVAGLAVCEALEGLLPNDLLPSSELRVKWPNDVYLAGRKVCGILCESVPGWRDRLVVGIGVNVNNRVASAGNQPTDRGIDVTGWEQGAIALIDRDGLARDLTGVLLALLDRFQFRWQMLIECGFSPLAAGYRSRCFLTGRTVTIDQPGHPATIGRCLGIDDRGALRIQTERGEQAIVSGSIAGWDAP